MEDLLRVGVISSAHGIKGEVNVFPTTDEPEMFEHWKTLRLVEKKQSRLIHVGGAKYFKNMVILKFKGYDNINDIEKYKSKDLLITRDHAVELGPDEYFITDLIGLQVLTEDGEALGGLKDVLETGANDVYVVEMKNGRELLIPAIKDCILDVDTEQGTMTVHLLEGLMDL